MAAAAVNPVDLGVAGGFFHDLGLVHQPRWTGLGWDFAGTVADTGPGVDLAPGERLPAWWSASIATTARTPSSSSWWRARSPAAGRPRPGRGVDRPAQRVGRDPGRRPARRRPRRGDRLLVPAWPAPSAATSPRSAQDRGWRVTGLARAHDDAFVTGLGAELTTQAEPGWDAVADAAVLGGHGLGWSAMRTYVGMRPGAAPAAERGITVAVIETVPDGDRLGHLLARGRSATSPARAHAVVPLDDVADAHRAVAKGGVRGRYVLTP